MTTNFGILKKLFLVAILLSFTSLIFFWYKKKQLLKSNFNLTVATVYKVSSGSKSGYICYFNYNLNKKEYLGSKKVFVSEESSNKLLLKKLPLVYEKDNIENNELLVFKEDFEEFGLIFPDSLNWAMALK